MGRDGSGFFDTLPVGGDAGPSPWRVVAGLALLAAGVRAVAAWRTAVMFNDGPSFLTLAALFRDGDWQAALAHAYHPLYPGLVAGVASVVGDLALAAVVVSVLAGAAGVIGLHAFVASAFGRGPAFLAAALYALHPYAAVYAADVQSEALYHAFFLGALACMWRGVEERSVRLAGLAGLLTGLAYLVRPEGLGVAVVGLALAALLLFQGRLPVPSFLRVAAATLVGVLLLAGPYVIHLHSLTGRWMLTQKKSVRDFTTPPEPTAKPPPGVPDRQRFTPKTRPPPREASLVPARIDFEPRAVSALLDLVVLSFGALHPVIALLLVLGAWSVRGPPGDRGSFLLLLLALYGVVLYGLALNVGYLDRRHVLAPLLPLLGYAALGVQVAGRALQAALRPRVELRSEAVGIWLVLLLVALSTLPKTWGAHREERLATRRAAEWLASEGRQGGAVAAEKHRTAWYAGEAFVRLDRGRDARALTRAGARFLIVDDAGLEKRPELAEACAAGVPLHRVEVAGRTAWVYELSELASPGSGAASSTWSD